MTSADDGAVLRLVRSELDAGPTVGLSNSAVGGGIVELRRPNDPDRGRREIGTTG